MIDEPNRWRLDTPGHEGWTQTARPGDPNKYFMVSCDSHTNEPTNLWRERLDAKYRDRLPRIEVDENGVKWQVSESIQRSRLLVEHPGGEDKVTSEAGGVPGPPLQGNVSDAVDVATI